MFYKTDHIQFIRGQDRRYTNFIIKTLSYNVKILYSQ